MSIKLGYLGLVVNNNAIGNTISSDMGDSGLPQMVVNAIERVVLDHFHVGVDVTSSAYREGVERAYSELLEPLKPLQESLYKALSEADSLTIEDDAIRYFNLGLEDEDTEVVLDAGEYQFALWQIDAAKKVGKTWFIPHENGDEQEHYQLTCEKVIPF